jgi:hypothetical protein
MLFLNHKEQTKKSSNGGNIMERTLKEKCKNCGCYEYLAGLQRFQCLATMETECFPTSQRMNLLEGEEETPELEEVEDDDDTCGGRIEYGEPDCEDDGDDFPLYLDYEGLYGSSEMDNCTEMGGENW